MDIGKFSCMPEVDLLPVTKRSNGDRMLRIRQVIQVTGTVEYVARDTLLFDGQRKLRVLFRGLLAVLAADSVFRVFNVCT